MAMVSAAFWLVRLAMLVGKCDGANDASGYQRVAAGQHGPGSSAAAAPGYALRAETGPDEFLKFP
jgi:hypothetical protein